MEAENYHEYKPALNFVIQTEPNRTKISKYLNEN